jgi:hypothetical protein
VRQQRPPLHTCACACVCAATHHAVGFIWYVLSTLDVTEMML